MRRYTSFMISGILALSLAVCGLSGCAGGLLPGGNAGSGSGAESGSAAGAESGQSGAGAESGQAGAGAENGQTGESPDGSGADTNAADSAGSPGGDAAEKAAKKPKPTPTVDPAAVDAEFATGRMENGIYILDFFDFQAMLPETWRYYDAAELASLNTTIQDGETAEEARTAIEEGSARMDMVAVNEKEGQSVNISIVKLGITSNIKSVEDYIENTFPMIEEQLSQQGFVNARVSKQEGMFVGKKVPIVLITTDTYAGDNETYPFYERQAYIQNGSYLACVTATSLVEDTTQKIFGLFTLPGIEKVLESDAAAAEQGEGENSEETVPEGEEIPGGEEIPEGEEIYEDAGYQDPDNENVFIADHGSKETGEEYEVPVEEGEELG